MVFVMIILCAMCLVGCSSIAIDIDTNAEVTGNGTLAVQKGDYLYFVNGYTAISDMNVGDNNGGNSYSAIYRAKLENGNLTYDEDGKVQNAQIIVDKIVGFNKTQLYIFGDYIYYATPNTEEPKDSEANRFEMTDFYSAKLNGEERALIYKTPTASTETKYAFYATEQNSTASKKQVHLALYQDSKLTIINCNNRQEVFSKSDVDSCIMPKMQDYLATNNSLTVQEQTIYFTYSADSGNVLASIKLGESQEKRISAGGNTYAVVDFAKEALLYTKKGKNESTACHYVASFAQDGSLLIDAEQQVDYISNSTMFICPFQNGNYQGVVFKNAEDGLTYTDANGEDHVLLDGKKLTPLCISNGYLYAYDSDNSIYKIDYLSNNATKIYNTQVKKDADDDKSENWPAPYFEAGRNFAVNGNYAYFYVKYTGDDDQSGYYLNRVKISVENGIAELVGVLESKHIKTPEVEEE